MTLLPMRHSNAGSRLSHYVAAGRLSHYLALQDGWRAICAMPITDADKTIVCLATLRLYIDQLALSCFRPPCTALRFYAAMMQLRLQLTSPATELRLQLTSSAAVPAEPSVPQRTNWLSDLFFGDYLHRLAVLPALLHVDDWLRVNSQEYGPVLEHGSQGSDT